MKKVICTIFLIAIAMLFLQQEGFAQSQSGSITKKDFFQSKKSVQKKEALQTSDPAPESLDNTHYVDPQTGETLPVSKQKGRKEDRRSLSNTPKPKE